MVTEANGRTSAVADICTLHKQWDEILCPICMDHPHNAVVLMCSSHGKGCRSYICDTSYRHSNCLDRYKKLRLDHEKNTFQSSFSYNERSENARHESLHLHGSDSAFTGWGITRNLMETHEEHNSGENNNGIAMQNTLEESNIQRMDVRMEAQGEQVIDFEESGERNILESYRNLQCPLCWGTVFKAKVIKEVRQYLDLKRRCCSRESCSFSGNYRELRRHARTVHPMTRPADVDPSRQRAWHRLEHQREYGDILSAIRSAMPDAIVLGDYVIENGDRQLHDRRNADSSEGSGSWWTTLFLFHMTSPFGPLDEPMGSSSAWRAHWRSSGHRDLWGENWLDLQGDDNEVNLNDHRIHVPRRRRRLTRYWQDRQHP